MNKRPPDLSEMLARSAAEALEFAQQAAAIVDAEWKQVIESIEDNESVPDPVKEAIGSFDSMLQTLRREMASAVETPGGDMTTSMDGLADHINSLAPVMAESGRRMAEQFGVTVPDLWGWGRFRSSRDTTPQPEDRGDQSPPADSGAAADPVAMHDGESAPGAEPSSETDRPGGDEVGAKKAATKKAGAKKAATKKARANKAATKKARANKAATKKAGANKAATKKAGAKKAGANKAATKKAGANKAATKKAGASKAATKKAGAKKAATKKSGAGTDRAATQNSAGS